MIIEILILYYLLGLLHIICNTKLFLSLHSDFFSILKILAIFNYKALKNELIRIFFALIFHKDEKINIL